jgi:hypothetical protein
MILKGNRGSLVDENPLRKPDRRKMKAIDLAI